MKNETPDNNLVTVRTQSSTKDIEAPATGSQFPDASKSVNLESDDAPDVQQQQPYGKLPGSKKKLYIALAIGIAIIGAGIAAVYFLLLQQPAQTDKNTDPLAVATKFDSPQALVDAIEPDLKGQVLIVAKESRGLSAADAEGYGIYAPPVYREEGEKFGNLPLEASGVGYKSNSEVAKSNYEAMLQFFKDNRFKQIVNKKNVTGIASATESANYESYAEYESLDMVCAIRHTDASGTTLKSHATDVGCASKASYRAAADRLQVFYTAYTAENPDKNNNLTFGFVDQGKGKDGFEYALLYQQDQSQFTEEDDSLVGGLIGYYLRESGDDKWHYFMGIQSGIGLLECSEFDSDALKSAFSGLPCFDEVAGKKSSI